MSRLPSVGSDNGTWGTVLNDFLSVSHAADGTLNSGTVGTGALASGAVTNAKLDSPTQSAIALANTAVQLTGAQTVAGAKTFSTAPTLPLGQALAGVTITSVQQITAAAYAALAPPVATTLYVIVG
jgi:hypothetical protein